MTTEQLRTTIVGDIDSILNAPIISRLLSADQRRLLQAQREYWLTGMGVELAVLLAILEKEP
jgi:hypothetical protein